MFSVQRVVLCSINSRQCIDCVKLLTNDRACSSALASYFPLEGPRNTRVVRSRCIVLFVFVFCRLVLFPFVIRGGGVVYSTVSSGGTFHDGGLFRGGGSGSDGGSDNSHISFTPGRGGVGRVHACVKECSCCRQRPCRGS